MEIKDAGQEVDNVLNLSIDDLFKDEEESQPQEQSEASEVQKNDTKQESNEMTQRVTNRINEVRRKTEHEVEERIAKQQGYNSYDEMLKAQEHKTFEEHGYDPDDLEKLLAPILEKRIANDPRFKKLEAYEQAEKNKYIENQLAEINKVSSNKYKSVNDLPQETLDLWSKGVDLEKAFLVTAGTDILNKRYSNTNKGSVEHMKEPESTTTVRTRGLTEDEKNMYRHFMPGITEEELAKKTIEIE